MKHLIKLTLFACFILFYCCSNDNEIPTQYLDFKTETVMNKDSLYLGQTIRLGVKLERIDTKNTSDYFTVINTSDNAGSIKINDGEYSQGSQYNHNFTIEPILYFNYTPSEKGNKVLTLQVSNEKFTRQVEYKIRVFDRLKDINISVDPASQNVKVNETANFKLSIFEEEYSGSFKVKYILEEGEGIYSGGEELTLAQGEHSQSFLPTKTGTHTFKLIAIDTRGQEAQTSVTVIASDAYNIKTSAQIGGTASGGGNIQAGENCTVTAKAEDGYNFVGWFENNILVSNAEEYSFVVDKSRDLEARFEGKVFTIVANASGNGDVSGGGEFRAGENCTVIATPQNGFLFEGWYENNSQVSTSPQFSFTVSASRNLEARFKGRLVNITVNALTGGSASGAGSYEFGKNCEVIAIPNSGYGFSGWFENGEKVSSYATYTFVVAGERTLEARFEPVKLTITVHAQPGGNTTGSGSYNWGTNCSALAKADVGFEFIGWFENGSQVATSNPYIFKVEKDRILEARFKKSTLKLIVTGDTGGTATGSGDYEYGQEVSLKATPNTGYTFGGWYEGSAKISSDNPYIINIVKERTIVAKFNINKYTLNLTAEVGGSVSGAGSYEHGKVVTAVASPSVDYDFDGWYENNKRISTNLQYAFNIYENKLLIARFTPKKFRVNITSTGGIHGATSGEGTYNSGSDVTLRATPPVEADFSGWYVNGSLVSTNKIYTFKIKENINIEARFNIVYFNVSVYQSNPSQKKYTVKRGESIRLECLEFQPSGPSSFRGWYADGKQLSNRCNYTFTPTKNTFITVQFDYW